jgi:hypothetical protein
MDIRVEDNEGVVRHYTSEQIQTINYRIEFTYKWDSGVEQEYVVKHMAEPSN